MGRADVFVSGEALVSADAMDRRRYSLWPKSCAVCRGLLGLTERKVHAGACARQRKTQLQAERRRRDMNT